MPPLTGQKKQEAYRDVETYSLQTKAPVPASSSISALSWADSDDITKSRDETMDPRKIAAFVEPPRVAAAANQEISTLATGEAEQQSQNPKQKKPGDTTNANDERQDVEQ